MAEVIGERLDYGTLLLGTKFSKREGAAMNLRRFYAINQIEYCRNFIFRRYFPSHLIFATSCEMGLWRLSAHQIREIFGSRVAKHAFVKQYDKVSTFLRSETAPKICPTSG